MHWTAQLGLVGSRGSRGDPASYGSHADCIRAGSPVEIMNTAIRAKATALTSMSCWIASRSSASTEYCKTLPDLLRNIYQTL